ncbi:MAG: hypothetical protein IKS20_01020 [Victivallales bacterium]|nr:hypothetical protein [Victivallales bacterium]
MNEMQIQKELGFDESLHDLIFAGWDITSAEMPADIPFLASGQIRQCCDFCQTGEVLCKELLRTAEIVNASPALKAFAWHVYDKLALHPAIQNDPSNGNFAGWPIPQIPEGVEKHFYRLAHLAIIPKAIENYRQKGIPEDTIRNTLHIGPVNSVFNPRSLAWTRHYLNAEIYWIDRFQFMVYPNNHSGLVLKNRIDGRKLMVCGPGIRLDKEGMFAMPGKEDDTDCISPFVETPCFVRGYPVNPKGFVELQCRTFPLSEWQIALRPSQPLIDMHIPSGGGMTLELCKQSFHDAFCFFEKYLPGRTLPIIRCHSWIFNRDLEPLLPDSNIARLMRECYVHPWISTGMDGMYFLFGGENHASWSEYPHDTSQRRALLHILESGRQLHCGGMLLFKEDMPHFGTSYYRRNYSL